jgi:hypothetical protein
VGNVAYVCQSCQYHAYGFREFMLLAKFLCWTFILGRPKILRMEAKIISQGSPKLFD